MKNSMEEILANAVSVQKNTFADHVRDILVQIKKAFEENQDSIAGANQVDIKNQNGFPVDFSIIQNIFNLLEKETLHYGDVTLSEKDDQGNILYGKEIMDKGVVLVIHDGNPYTFLEIALRNLVAGNTTILSNNGFMLGTNQLMIEIMQSVLEQFQQSPYFVQMYLSEDFDDILSNYANIDLVVCIGDHDLQCNILNKSKIPVLLSGYENYDLYIEDASHIDFLNQILATGVSLKIFIQEDTEVDHPEAIIVTDIDEAIAQINYTGSHFSAGIFTNDPQHASQFIKEVKAQIVTVNTSPSIERILDISQQDLTIEKTIISPITFHLDGSRKEF